MTSSANRLPAWLLPALGLLPFAAAAQTYTLTDLGTFGGATSFAYGINAAGTVVGTADFHAFTWHGGVMTDIGSLHGGSRNNGFAISTAGAVAGATELGPANGQHAFSNSGGTLTDLGTLAGNRSAARGINAAGTVVGESFYLQNSPDFFTHAFRYSGGVMTDLGVLGAGGLSSAAKAINDAGTIVGWADNSDGVQRAFSYSGGVMTDLGVLPAGHSPFGYSEALGINANGTVVVGDSQTATFEVHAFSYSGGVMSDLGALGGNKSSGLGVNDAGTVVGYSRLSNSSTEHAFAYHDGGMFDLNGTIPGSPGWVLNEATGINDDGLIVGFGTDPLGDTHAFLLTPDVTPVPEPAAYAAVAGVGLLAFAGWRRRNR